MVRHYRTTTQHANGASITASNPTLTVGTLLAGEGLSGAPASYTVRVCKSDGTNAEEMDVTDVSLYPQVTVTRGINHTTPVAHDTTEIITQVVGENDLDALWSAISGAGTGDMNWRGTWSASTTYATNDVVSYGSRAYVCVSSISGSSSNSAPFADPTHWSPAAGRPTSVVMYNYGFGASETYNIGIGWSFDDRTFTRTIEPVIAPGTGWESSHVKDPCLVIVGGVYYCYYSGFDGSAYKIGLAQSFDSGQTWTKYASNPVLTTGQSWEATGGTNEVRYPVVLYDASETDSTKQWKMWYTGGTGGVGGIGYAYSSDGLSWTKYASNPVLARSSGWEVSAVSAATIVKIGPIYYLFYNGSGSGGVYPVLTGLLTFTSPTGTMTKSASNPLLIGDGITTAISSNVGVGDQTITVASSTSFPIGAPIFVYDSTTHNRFLSTVLSRPSTTQIKLADATPLAITSAAGTAWSPAYNSVVARSVLYDGAWRFAVCPFNPGGGPSGYGTSYLLEVSMLAYADNALTAITLDYGAGFILKPTLAESQNAQASLENPWIVSLATVPKRYLGGVDPYALIQQGATDGQVLAWSNANKRYQPTTAAGGTPDSVRCTNSAAQIIANNTPTAITFDTNRWDTNTMHSTSTNTSRLTCKTAGKHLIEASIGLGSSTTGEYQFAINLNGSTFIAVSRDYNLASTPLFRTISTTYNLAVNDYVELMVTQTSGGNESTVQGGNYSPEFMMTLIG